jgi:hypothetical protein
VADWESVRSNFVLGETEWPHAEERAEASSCVEESGLAFLPAGLRAVSENGVSTVALPRRTKARGEGFVPLEVCVSSIANGLVCLWGADGMVLWKQNQGAAVLRELIGALNELPPRSLTANAAASGEKRAARERRGCWGSSSRHGERLYRMTVNATKRRCRTIWR